MVIDNKFEIGQIVYLKTDEDRRMRIVCAIRIVPGAFLYVLACGKEVSDHYDFELTEEKIEV